MRKIEISFFILMIVLASCSDNQGGSTGNYKPGTDRMADLNTYMVRKDRERIQNYIARKNLSMTETSTGLWYQIIKEGEGDLLSENEKIIMDYECALLDGTKCYSSAGQGPKELIIGKSVMEAGLNEGLRLLRPGAEAIFIIPPFLAYGLIGDRNKIPPRAVLVYNVSVRRDQPFI